MAWADWVLRFTTANAGMDGHEYGELHPLAPDLDLPIFQIAGKFHTLAEFRRILANESIVHIHFDFITAHEFEEEYEDLLAQKKPLGRKPKKVEVWMTPGPSLIALRLGFPSVNYLARVRMALSDEWGMFAEYVRDWSRSHFNREHVSHHRREQSTRTFQRGLTPSASTKIRSKTSLNIRVNDASDSVH